MKRGERVFYLFKSTLNGRPTIHRKEGTYQGLVKHRLLYLAEGRPQLAYVKFDGNKNLSKVPLHRLNKTIERDRGLADRVLAQLRMNERLGMGQRNHSISLGRVLGENDERVKRSLDYLKRLGLVDGNGFVYWVRK